MVGWEQALGADGVDRVADYLGVLGTDAAAGHPGQAQYNIRYSTDTTIIAYLQILGTTRGPGDTP